VLARARPMSAREALRRVFMMSFVSADNAPREHAS
jgi:hypothetical protein